MPDETIPPPLPAAGAPSSNRGVMIVLSYLWLLALVPLLVEKDDKEVQWHAKHGIVLMLAELFLWIAMYIVQAILGTILGCRFLGIDTRMLFRAGLYSLGATVLTLCLAVAGAFAMQAGAGVGLDQAMLALAPGGLTEMGLIALAIHADVAFVALHHVVRILVVIVVAPVLVRLVQRDR